MGLKLDAVLAWNVANGQHTFRAEAAAWLGVPAGE